MQHERDTMTGAQVPDRPFEVNRVQSCLRQIEAAIAALWVGDYDIAITLAGSAEDMFDRPSSLFSFAIDNERIERFGLDKKQVIDHLNRERDWLKHQKEPDTMTFTLRSAGFMIARALTKLAPEHS